MYQNGAYSGTFLRLGRLKLYFKVGGDSTM